MYGQTNLKPKLAFDFPYYFAVTADMSSATWNTQATHEIATVTGMVRILVIPECTETLVDAADGASIQFGHASDSAAIIASTGAAGAGGNTISTGEQWVDATPADISVLKAAIENLDFTIANGVDVGYEITGAALTEGTMVFHVFWCPISSTGAVVAGAGGVL